MNKELLKKAKIVFDTYHKEITLYCIDNRNFWLLKDKVLAEMYSKKLNKELLVINKSDIIEEIPKIKSKTKTKSKKTKKIKK